MSTSSQAAASTVGAAGAPGICASGVSTGAATAAAVGAAAGPAAAARGFGSADVVVPPAGAGAACWASVDGERAQIANASAQDSGNGRMNIIEKRVIIRVGMPFLGARAFKRSSRRSSSPRSQRRRSGLVDGHAGAEQVAVAVDVVD